MSSNTYSNQQNPYSPQYNPYSTQPQHQQPQAPLAQAPPAQAQYQMPNYPQQTSFRQQEPPTPLSDLKGHLGNIDDFLKHYSWVMIAEEKTGIRRAYLFLGAIGVMSLMVLYSHGADALCNLVGFMYPMYASFKALKTEVKDDDTEWLTYWVVYGFCTLVEDFCQAVFNETAWSTIYFTGKIVFLLWLYLPQTKGANIVYKLIVEPILSRYEQQIDREVELTIREAEGVFGEVKQKDGAEFQRTVNSALSQVAQRSAAQVIQQSVNNPTSASGSQPPHSNVQTFTPNANYYDADGKPTTSYRY